jgi:hypothetical protein
MANGTGDTPSYVDSGLSTTVPEKEHNDFEPTYDIASGTGEAEYDTSKPTRIKFYVKRVEGP